MGKTQLWVLSSLNLCNFPSRRSLRSLSCYFVVSLCVYICVCGKILQAALQCHHITTGGWVSPRAALWVASHPCVCVWERERGRESITSTSHTRPAALLTHQWLWPCPDARYSLSHLFLLSLSIFIIIAPARLMILPHKLCCFSWMLSKSYRLFVVEDRKRFQSLHRKCSCSHRCWYTQYYRQANNC